ncbi:MAG: DinB family protein [Gemmatimonadaceae bacterium]
MRPSIRPLLLAAALVAVRTLPAAAQTPSTAATAAKPAGLTADILTDVSQVERKFLALARAIPEDKYGWRPGEGTRSVGEVILHVSADNYLMPGALGFPVDAATGIKPSDYKTAEAFEKRTMGKDAAIAELEKSFAFLKKSLTATTPTKMGEKFSMFGQSFTGQQTWIMTATHVHEHLGQFIAYARSNGIKPPWS